MNSWKLVSFVDGQAAFHALEVPSRLLECVLVRSLWVLLLDFKELLDGAGPCELLPNRFVRAEIRLWCFVDQEFTVLLEMLFNDFHRKSLINSGMACMALVAAPVRGPLVLVGLPRELALVDEALLVLLRVVPCPAYWLFVDVMLRVFEHLLKSGCMWSWSRVFCQSAACLS